MKKALVLVFSNLRHDARVKRQVNWLSKNYDVTVVCFDADELPHVRYIKVKQTKLRLIRKGLLALALLSRSYKTAYRLLHGYDGLKVLRLQNYDVVVANDIDTLPLAFQLQPRSRIVFDAHEYAPRHFENNRTWKTFFQPFYIHLCRKYIPETTAMLTVGKGLADEYARSFHVEPVIITNATRYVEIEPSDVAPDRIRLVHHGIVNPSRRLELMVEMMDRLEERFTLDMILMTSDYASSGTKRYIQKFMAYAKRNPRISILPPVPSDQVVETINKYDMGVFLIPPVNFNYANTLPNKLFDFIQARLGIAIGPSPEMAAIVREFENGVVSANFEPSTLAAQLNRLTRQEIMEFKRRSILAAKALNAERNEVLFNQTLLRAISIPSHV